MEALEDRKCESPRQWTREEIAALPVTVPLVVAASAIGMGRTAAYEAARRGDLPFPVLRLGSRYRVASAHIRALLGVEAA